MSARTYVTCRGFLRESSRLRIFDRGVKVKKELFSWADLQKKKSCTFCITSLFQ